MLKRTTHDNLKRVRYKKTQLFKTERNVWTFWGIPPYLKITTFYLLKKSSCTNPVSSTVDLRRPRADLELAAECDE